MPFQVSHRLKGEGLPNAAEDAAGQVGKATAAGPDTIDTVEIDGYYGTAGACGEARDAALERLQGAVWGPSAFWKENDGMPLFKELAGQLKGAWIGPFPFDRVGIEPP
jgi:hypothetical protein